MPHIIVEYSQNLESQIDVPNLLHELHQALAAEGIDKERIKTRGIALNHAVVGDEGTDDDMMHTTLLLLEGRDIPTKKKYGDALYAVMNKCAPNGYAVTLEIRDMSKDTYYM